MRWRLKRGKRVKFPRMKFKSRNACHWDKRWLARRRICSMFLWNRTQPNRVKLFALTVDPGRQVARQADRQAGNPSRRRFYEFFRWWFALCWVKVAPDWCVFSGENLGWLMPHRRNITNDATFRVTRELLFFLLPFSFFQFFFFLFTSFFTLRFFTRLVSRNCYRILFSPLLHFLSLKTHAEEFFGWFFINVLKAL